MVAAGQTALLYRGVGGGKRRRVKFYYTTLVRQEQSQTIYSFGSNREVTSPLGTPARYCVLNVRQSAGTVKKPSSNCGGNSTLIQFPAIALIYGDEDVNYVTGKQLPVVSVSGGPSTAPATGM